MGRQELRLVWLFAKVVGNLLSEFPPGIDLPPAQFMALRFIGLHEQPNLGALAEALGVSNAAATKLADRLVKKGLVARTEGPVDRRERRLILTERGASLYEAAASVGEARLEQIWSCLSADDRQAVQRGLAAFLTAALREPAEVRRICLRCGREHEPDCPGEEIYRNLGGEPRQV